MVEFIKIEIETELGALKAELQSLKDELQIAEDELERLAKAKSLEKAPVLKNDPASLRDLSPAEIADNRALERMVTTAREGLLGKIAKLEANLKGEAQALVRRARENAEENQAMVRTVVREALAEARTEFEAVRHQRMLLEKPLSVESVPPLSLRGLPDIDPGSALTVPPAAHIRPDSAASLDITDAGSERSSMGSTLAPPMADGAVQQPRPVLTRTRAAPEAPIGPAGASGMSQRDRMITGRIEAHGAKTAQIAERVAPLLTELSKAQLQWRGNWQISARSLGVDEGEITEILTLRKKQIDENSALKADIEEIGELKKRADRINAHKNDDFRKRDVDVDSKVIGAVVQIKSSFDSITSLSNSNNNKYNTVMSDKEKFDDGSFEPTNARINAMIIAYRKMKVLFATVHVDYGEVQKDMRESERENLENKIGELTEIVSRSEAEVAEAQAILGRLKDRRLAAAQQVVPSGTGLTPARKAWLIAAARTLLLRSPLR